MQVEMKKSLIYENQQYKGESTRNLQKAPKLGAKTIRQTLTGYI